MPLPAVIHCTSPALSVPPSSRSKIAPSKNESHGFQACMRVRTTNWLVADVKMIVHQQDEGIVHLEV
jgi:hypothetical protein